MKRAMRVLVPIDFSNHSWATLRFALRLQNMIEPVLVLLHVIPPADYDELALLDGPSQTEHRQEDVLEFLQQETSRRLPQEGVPRLIFRVTQGIPFSEICRVADEEKVEMILIGTHGRTGLSHLLIGSTAERVVQHSSCPVLSIKPKLL